MVQFPNFQPLTLQDRSWIDGLTVHGEPYSDYTFTSMYCWGLDHMQVAELHGNLVVQFVDYHDTSRRFLGFSGVHSVTQTAIELLEYSKQQYGQHQLEIIPQMVVDHIDTSLLEVVSDPNNHDYILSIEEHSVLEGAPFKKRRNMLKKFHGLGVETRLVFEQELYQEHLAGMRTLLLAWAKQKKDPAVAVEEEVHLDRLLECAATGDFLFTYVYKGDTLIAYAVLEKLQSQYAILHFEKTNLAYPGLSVYLMQQSTRVLHQYGYRYLNIEQDLGEAGLRTMKQLRRPSHMLQKYLLRRRGK